MCLVRLCLHDSRVKMCGVFTRGGLESSGQEFNKPFFHHLHLLFWKVFCKVHEEPFERAFNCFPCIFQHFSTPDEISTRPPDLGLDSTRVVM